MKKAVALILTLLALAGELRAVMPEHREAQIEAATGDAILRLRAEIESQPLSPSLDVATFLQASHGFDALLQTLRRAEQIGGPRWIDDETCQVNLSIRGSRVRQTLVQIATDNRNTAPLPPEALEAKLAVWEDRLFTATGTSISAQRAEALRPPDVPGPWRGIDDDARRGTIVAARENAVDRVIDSLRPIEIENGTSLSTLLSHDAVVKSLKKWLSQRPVTRVEFNNDLSITITLSAPPRDVLAALVSAAEQAGQRDALPGDPLKMARLRQTFEDQVAPCIGAARVPAAPALAQNTVLGFERIPRKPPGWIDVQLSAEATAKKQASQLRTVRWAEDEAREMLRKKIDRLQFSQMTIGEAAKRDPEVERAVQQALRQVRNEQTEYLPDGSAKVKLRLDPRDLWEELSKLP